jgi:hypothetical protein
MGGYLKAHIIVPKFRLLIFLFSCFIFHISFSSFFSSGVLLSSYALFSFNELASITITAFSCKSFEKTSGQYF